MFRLAVAVFLWGRGFIRRVIVFKIPEYKLANPNLQSCWYVSLSVNVRYSDRET